MTTIHQTPRSPLRAVAAVAAAAAASSALLAPAPAAATATHPAGCDTSQPYAATASADLLRLHALDLRPLGVDLGLGPAAEVRVATTGAGLDTATGPDGPDGPAAMAAARDASTNLLGLDVLDLAGATGLGHTVTQQAPPDADAPATHTGTSLDLGVLRADLGTMTAGATWDEAMRCGEATGDTAEAAADLADAAVLPGSGERALATLSAAASRTGTGLVDRDGITAAQAEAAASLAELELFAGSGAPVAVRVISEPELRVTATGQPDTSTVEYQAPVLEISGAGLAGTERLDAPGTHLDLALSGDTPLAGLLGALDPALAGLGTGPGDGAPLPELAGLAGRTGGVPVLDDLLREVGALPELGGSAALRLSLGALHQEVAGDGTLVASAASLRLQLLARDLAGGGGGDGAAVVDLGIGLLHAAATAPAPAPAPAPDPAPSAPPPADGCDDCPEPVADRELPVTGSAVGGIVGTGVLLALAGWLLTVLGSWPGRGRARHRRAA